MKLRGVTVTSKTSAETKKHQLGTARFAAAAATATSTSTSATAAAATSAADVYRQNNDFKYCARLLRINEKLLLAFETVTACYVSRLTTKRQKLLFLLFFFLFKNKLRTNTNIKITAG